MNFLLHQHLRMTVAGNGPVFSPLIVWMFRDRKLSCMGVPTIAQLSRCFVLGFHSLTSCWLIWLTQKWGKLDILFYPMISLDAEKKATKGIEVCLPGMAHLFKRPGTVHIDRRGSRRLRSVHQQTFGNNI